MPWLEDVMKRVLQCSQCPAVVHVGVREATETVICPNGHENKPGSFGPQVREFTEREDVEKR